MGRGMWATVETLSLSPPACAITIGPAVNTLVSVHGSEDPGSALDAAKVTTEADLRTVIQLSLT